MLSVWKLLTKPGWKDKGVDGEGHHWGNSKHILAWKRKNSMANSKKLMEATQKQLNELYERGTTDLQRLKELERDLRNAKSQEEEYWRVRSHIEWLKGGDRNSAYFYAFVKVRGEESDCWVM
ncbi:hypothetical protein Scep_024285 [Stephania cephalantha]|uniref:Uncharacterized protein n=1 Tax=Stephania cephalantha TaxID=152367 RepID=A0AAP0EWA0_9MAGN